jgi:Protein of unknown function (DUF2958)
MPWYEKSRPAPFDSMPIEGQFHLDGDLLARLYLQEWLRAKKYPVITFPSGLQRELWDSSDDGGILNIFGAFELMRVSTRDEGFEQATDFANQYGYTVSKRGDADLLIVHPISRRGYRITYDNPSRQIANVIRFPEYAMELLDIEHRAVLPELYSNEQLGLDALALVKFFTPDGNWTWYASEYDGEDLFFGLVSGFEVELGYFSLTELEGVKGALGLPIERDNHFSPTPLRNLQEYHKDGR